MSAEGFVMTRRSFSSLSLQDALDLVPTERLTKWDLIAPDCAPSDVLLAYLPRLDSFSLISSEPAKILLIDTILGEIATLYPQIKIWKGEPLEWGLISGVADYLVAPNRAYAKTPLLCAIEAGYPLGGDDFVQGEAQCIGEMVVCQQNNARDGHESEVYGIVSNGQVWVFYKLTPTSEVLVSRFFAADDLPKLLGALDHVFAACAANIPAKPDAVQ